MNPDAPLTRTVCAIPSVWWSVPMAPLLVRRVGDPSASGVAGGPRLGTMAAMVTEKLRAIALVCTLTPSPDASSSQLLAEQLLEELSSHGVEGTAIRVVDHEVKPGVQLDMGGSDAWPEIRRQLMAADILVFATPTWMGQHSSVAQRVLERLDAELSEKDDEGRLQTFGKVAVV